jgi:iron complex transport system ATP-binding protein
MTTLRAQDLSVSLGRKLVLDRVSLSAQSGELICVLGPNGAGKSTLLRALSGALKSHAVHVNERAVKSLTPRQRALTLSWLSQNGQAAWPLPARAIVALGRLPHGVTLDRLTAQDEAAIDAALRLCDVQAFAERDVTTLSGGERARVLLARALAVQAPILLADEPVAALDPQHQLSVMQALRDEAKQGRLVMAVLHDLALAARFADRIILMREGVIMADGKPDEVLTATLLGEVFGVEIASFERDGTRIVLPWATRA